MFLTLTTDAEREEFIGQFWLRRDPTPDTFENEYKEEHYRRIAYANRWFTAGVAGWRTDRGHIFVMYGEPDQIKRPEGPFLIPYDIDKDLVAQLGYHPAQSVPAYPSQKWRYNYIDGVGQNIELEFVDKNGTNAFGLAWDPGEKFGYIPVPGGVFDAITTGLIGNMSRHVAIDLRSKRLTQMVDMAKVLRPLERRVEPTEEEIRTRLIFNMVPFQMRADFFRGSGKTARVPVTLSFRKTDLAFKLKGKNYHAKIALQGFVINLVGRTVETFEAGVNWTVPSNYLNDPDPIVYHKLIKLPPGNYKIHVEVKDLTNGSTGTHDERIIVPDYNAKSLSHSSLILAGRWGKAKAQPKSSAQIIIGNQRVQPSISRKFRTDQRLGVFMQVYNLGLDPETSQPNATIRYTILADDGITLDLRETTSELGITADELAIEKLIPLESSLPGTYSLRIIITDHVSNQTIEPQTNFTVVKR